MGNGTEEDPFIIIERVKGAFDKFLHTPTTIYELPDKHFYKGTSYEGELVTHKKVQIQSKTQIDDIYEFLKSSGNVKFYHYPDRPPDIPLDNSDLIEDRIMPSYRVAQTLKERFDIVKKLVRIHPNLLPKIVKRLVKETLNNITNRNNNKRNLLPSVEEKDHAKEDASYRESLKEGTPTLEEQATYSNKIRNKDNASSNTKDNSIDPKLPGDSVRRPH